MAWTKYNERQIQKDIKNWTKLNKIIKGKNVTCFIFATNLRQSKTFRMQFIFSGWGLRRHTPSRGFAPAPYEGALSRPPRPPACFRYFCHQLKSSLVLANMQYDYRKDLPVYACTELTKSNTILSSHKHAAISLFKLLQINFIGLFQKIHQACTKSICFLLLVSVTN